MRNILVCRRTFIAMLAIGSLFALGVLKGIDVSSAIAAVAMGLAGANAGEAAMKSKFQKP